MSRPSVVGVTLIAAFVAVVFVAANIQGLDLDQISPGSYVRLYDPPDNRLEVIVNQGDGQAFAALAQDPLLRRPDVFRGAEPEAAYRAQRPLLGWLTWGLSAGQADLVPLVLVVLSIAAFVGLAAVLARLFERRGVSPAWALIVLVTPGALITLDWTGPESLGTAVALAGMALWIDGRRRWALVALIAAALCRESLLLVPLALAAHGLVVERQRWRSLLPLATPFAVYGAWVGVVWLRLDAVPTDAGRGRLSLPFAGLVDAADRWDPADLACAVLLIAVGLAALVIGRRDPAGWIAGAFVLASLVFGAEVWARVEDFSRILLPIVAFAAIVLIPWRAAQRRPHRVVGTNISS